MNTNIIILLYITHIINFYHLTHPECNIEDDETPLEETQLHIIPFKQSLSCHYWSLHTPSLSLPPPEGVRLYRNVWLAANHNSIASTTYREFIQLQKHFLSLSSSSTHSSSFLLSANSVLSCTSRDRYLSFFPAPALTATSVRAV